MEKLNGPSAYQLKQPSPLESLVRRTSTRKASDPATSSRKTPEPASSHSYSPDPPYEEPRALYHHHPHRTAPLKDHSASPTPGQGPPSPLLHGHFSRGSTATATTFATFDNRSYLDLYGDDDRDDNDQAYDEHSVYSFATGTGTGTEPPARDSWEARSHTAIRDSGVQPRSSTSSAPRPSTSTEAQGHHTLPSVVVSVPDLEPDEPMPRSHHYNDSSASTNTVNKTPSRVPSADGGTRNFSRPVRATAPGTPPIPSEAQKFHVLERNANRSLGGGSPNQQHHHQHSSHPYSPKQGSPLQSNTPVRPDEGGYFPQQRQPSPGPSSAHMQQFSFPRGPAPSSPLPQAPHPGQGQENMLSPRSHSPSAQRSLSSSQSQSQYASRSNSSSSPHPHPHPHSQPPSPSYPTSPSTTAGLSTPRSLALPRGPPSLRPSSPSSLYSNYSYYGNLEHSPSPTSTSFKNHANNATGGADGARSKHLSTLTLLKHAPPPPTESSHAHELLHLGITAHEADRLSDAASLFAQSAREEGGCGVGMLMFGLTLRHGWGCAKDEEGGFGWLRRAAERSVVDLERVRGGKGNVEGEVRVLQSELVLAIYEVGQCFFHGWGVAKDQKMAVSYYAVAARLGDSDAQNDLGFCLAEGKGCKKDRKEAAKWYREAVKQGISDVGLAWIYKDKYM
ncbi:hypothetical protein BDV98DRAFT_570648 [Pterulicium gracile]|uniref:HCP-like protein n=1 Tax=Pterulicium gracile TaxID=1884261 RepID=A0A5C3QC66_9AGAR|nr:hypothetical protein BDV98DRAFT_570648 [Pterula gracilis]